MSVAVRWEEPQAQLDLFTRHCDNVAVRRAGGACHLDLLEGASVAATIPLTEPDRVALARELLA